MRFLTSLALLLLASLAQGAATYTVDCSYGGTDPTNKVTQATDVSAEQSVQVKVTPGHPVTIELYASSDWYFRSATGDSTTQKPVSASQVNIIRITSTTTFYELRQSADGTLYITPLKVE